MRRSFIVVAASIVVACSAADRPAAPVSARFVDSAGVTIVYNEYAAEIDTLLWAIDSVPALEIGSTTGADPYLFGRVVGYTRMSDGRILVADAQTTEIRAFDSTGVFIANYGRRGQGPGEFINLVRVEPYPGDSILVVDYEGLRATVLTSDGRYVRSFRPGVADNPAHALMAPDVIGIFRDGTMLVAAKHEECLRNASALPSGYCESTASLYRLDEKGAALTQYGKHLESRSILGLGGGKLPAGFGSMFPRVFVRVFEDYFYLVDGGRPEVKVFHRTRGLVRIIRFPDDRVARTPELPVLPPRPADVPAPNKEFTIPGDAELKSAVAKMDLPKFARYVSAVQVDRGGNIWLEDIGTGPSTLSVAGTGSWWVFDSTGVLVTKLRVPRQVMVGGWAFAPVGPEVGADYVLAAGKNVDRVDVVRLYRITKRK